MFVCVGDGWYGPVYALSLCYLMTDRQQIQNTRWLRTADCLALTVGHCVFLCVVKEGNTAMRIITTNKSDHHLLSMIHDSLAKLSDYHRSNITIINR